MKRLILSLFFLVLTGCSAPSIQARSLYTSRRDLASYVVDTPDPEKGTKRLGQKIWVTWFTPVHNDATKIISTIRFEDGSERRDEYPVSSYAGDMSIEISPEEYQKTGGLLCYKIVLCQGKEAVAATQHKLWVEKIEIKN